MRLKLRGVTRRGARYEWTREVWVALAVLAFACGGATERSLADATTSSTRLYEGFTLITGDDRQPIEGAAFLVDDGIVQAVGRRGELILPPGAHQVDLTGKTVMPAIVSLHGHPGFQVGLTFGPENYNRKTLSDHLDRYAYYGVGTIVSLGTDHPGDLIHEIKASQENGTLGGARVLTAGGGIARPNGGPGFQSMRSSAIGVNTEGEAREAVRGLALEGVDVVKIWIDDRAGSVEKLGPELVAAVVEEAHIRDLKVIAHIFNAADAADAVAAGVDGFAHLARDEEMASELAAAMARRDIFVMPNLGVSQRFMYTEAPDWLEDPLLHESIAPDVIDRAKKSFANQSTEGAEAARKSWGYMQTNFSMLKDAGVRLVMGPDSGVLDGFMGYSELRELELMVNFGLSPAEAIIASTSVSAEALGIDEAGVLTAGRSADFIVLNTNPLEDISNARDIDRVFLKGIEVNRMGLRRRWRGK